MALKSPEQIRPALQKIREKLIKEQQKLRAENLVSSPAYVVPDVVVSRLEDIDFESLTEDEQNWHKIKEQLLLKTVKEQLNTSGQLVDNFAKTCPQKTSRKPT